jgi:hypothetical protein
VCWLWWDRLDKSATAGVGTGASCLSAMQVQSCPGIVGREYVVHLVSDYVTDDPPDAHDETPAPIRYLCCVLGFSGVSFLRLIGFTSVIRPYSGSVIHPYS